MRTRAAHLGPQLRRPLLLDAALPLFARDGYDAVSMQAIADAAGVSKPVLYSCFDSKDELFAVLQRREERKLWERVEASVPQPGDPGDREELLRHGLAALLHAVQAEPDAFRVIYLQRQGDDRVQRGREAWERRMAEVLVSWSGVPEREAGVLGRLLVALAEIGFRIQLEEPGAWEADALADYLASVMTRGIGTG
ncbi:TetR/AcrR family transcriptional regulator [Baekduia soli]|uniref:TetR/AcrR family transcriptional regulator n=1 Tax=Baekduia soli TaxID=496014 RepID=A0A5B8UCT0_9ACTN|nr:TetR/AcrR family transcriptional regulator [Baekduia soli]QEC50481.1 TetR/AcrR family transcriptional regulator [Baekduia soli]